MSVCTEDFKNRIKNLAQTIEWRVVENQNGYNQRVSTFINNKQVKILNVCFYLLMMFCCYYGNPSKEEKLIVHDKVSKRGNIKLPKQLG